MKRSRGARALDAGRGKAQFRDWPLGPNLGQCCGGMVTTLTETFDAHDLAMVRQFEAAEKSGAFEASQPLGDDGRIAREHLCRRARASKSGRATSTPTKHRSREAFRRRCHACAAVWAGHVGRALVLALAPLPFAVRWIDSRPNEFPPHVPQNVVTVCTGRFRCANWPQAPPTGMVIVMTHSHALDFDITAAALKRRTFDFVGLIGSDTKRARFAAWARQMGVVQQSDHDRLICPIGILEIRGKEPATIAAGLAAQLLIVRERASVPLPSPATQPA